MRASLPQGFIDRLHEMYGEALVNQIIKTFIERPTTFRANTLKATRREVMEWLQVHGFKAQPLSWYPDAFVLKNKSHRALTETELYTSGKIYVQSLASMVPPLVLDPKPGEIVLDLTAAPGSKTSQIAALMGVVGELRANDNNKIRFERLAHNMDLLGVMESRKDWAAALTCENGTDLCQKFPAYFDKILLDAPCSAEARFIAGQSGTYGFWSERTVKDMAYKQRQLLLAAWEALKPGGTLVYSTCTLAPEENEMQINRLFERAGDAVKIKEIKISGLQRLPIVSTWKDVSMHAKTNGCLRVLPTTDIEAFFVAKIEKN